MNKAEMLQMLDEQKVQGCTKCPSLCEFRMNTVFGEGNPDADLMFIGEAPGQQEDQQGRPFVGPAGNLLDGMIQACGWRREDTFIANPLKCRPPGNRTPTKEEIENCRAYLILQIKIVNPRYIVCLGRVAAQWFFDQEIASVGSMRGIVHAWHGRKLVVTYHPSYVLHSQTDQEADQKKRLIWADLQLLMEEKRKDEDHQRRTPTEGVG